MPKIVDASERRAMLVDAVLRVLQQEGVEGVTIRAVADAAGVSSGLLHHYFPGGKSELLHAAVTAAVDRGQHRMLRVLDERTGLAAVRAVAWELLPVVPERRAEWSAWVALWGHVLTNRSLGQEQRERLDSWRTLLATLLDQAVQAGELPPAVDVAGTALRLAGMLDGLGLHSLIQPDDLTPQELVAQVDAFLASVAG
jgi:AcrR family transcriptional regulator